MFTDSNSCSQRVAIPSIINLEKFGTNMRIVEQASDKLSVKKKRGGGVKEICVNIGIVCT